MPSICLLTSTDGEPNNDNAARLARAWAEAAWRVVVADHRDIQLARDSIVLAPHGEALVDFDLIWLIGLGERSSFLDRMQLLQHVAATRFVNAPLALATQHAKHQLPLGPAAAYCPETYVSTDPEWLAGIVAGGGTWVVKPTASSFGREVYRVTAGDSNLRPILAALTGHDGSRYCLLQRYVSEIEQGETRVLMAAGEYIGAYRRRATSDHRSNLADGGRAEPIVPSAAELELAQRVARYLLDLGIAYVAIDLAYPWIVELNVANPGGLATIERLTGVNLAATVVAALIRRCQDRPG